MYLQLIENRMRRIYSRILWLGFLCILSFVTIAQTDTTGADLEGMSLQELLKVKIATNKDQILEEAPSIVSVITKKEIEAYGCREISDVLRLVPGFEFGADVLGNTGYGFRGIWVQEGKGLLMLNGITLNELGFGTYTFVGTLPASIIEKVEIIRGPGSALYGGFAEVCVINIITVPSKNSNSVSLSASGGLIGRKGYAINTSLSASGNHEGLKYNFNIGYSNKPQSTRKYHDFFGNSFQMDNNTAFKKWKHVITELSYKGLTFDFHSISLDYEAKDGLYIIGNDFLGQSQEEYNHVSNAVSLKYEAKIGSKFRIIPFAEYITGNTITAAYSPLSVSGIYNLYGRQKLQRYKGEITGKYDFGKPGELTVSGGYVRDMVANTSTTGTPGLFSPQGDSVFSLYTESKYLIFQYIANINNFGFTAGNRYENTSFGQAFAPRAGITFYKNKFNSKLLYGKGYRIPLPWQAYSRIVNFDINNKLVAEVSSTLEFEIGYKLNTILAAKVNTYYINIDKPISYTGAINSYQNFGKIQSRGIEAELTANFYKSRWFLNCSYTSPGEKTSEVYLTADKKQFLALPAYKVTLGGFQEFNNVTVGPTFTLLSKRYGESQDHAQGLTTGYENTRYDALLLTNLNITYKSNSKKIDISLSVYNLFNQEYLVIQPYYGAHAPLPANDRQITMGVKLNL
jgi:outer membrane cobalamin receptor